MLLLPLVRAARSEARPLNFQRLALKAANFDSTGIPYEEKGKYPVLFVCRKKNQKTKHFGPYRGRIGAVYIGAVSGPYRDDFGYPALLGPFSFKK